MGGALRRRDFTGILLRVENFQKVQFFYMFFGMLTSYRGYSPKIVALIFCTFLPLDYHPSEYQKKTRELSENACMQKNHLGAIC